MSKQQHTPGPWLLATSCSWRRFVSERGEAVVTPTIQHSDNHPDLIVSRADAALIEAAPELLEALQELHDAALEDMRMYDISALGKQVRAAIAKATGGDQ